MELSRCSAMIIAVTHILADIYGLGLKAKLGF
jgi:hypothetical protein